MSIRRFTTAVDGSIPIQALLYGDEELLGSQEAVGIYDGNVKSPSHQSGSVHATSHRLFFISASSQAFPSSRDASDAVDGTSFVLDLPLITGSEYYAGLFASSPKVTLHLTRPAAATGISTSSSDLSYGGNGLDSVFDAWTCEVCANRNPPGLSPQAARICALCGVPRSSVPVSSSIAMPRATPMHLLASSGLSTSLPSGGLAGSSSTSTPGSEDVKATDGLHCPACTFLNHRSLRECEICGTTLPKPPSKPRIAASAASAPASRPDSPDDGQAKVGSMRLSFRKGGDKKFYETLKRALQAKSWEIKPARTQRVDGTQSIGIHGVLNMMENTAMTTETSVTTAFTDLTALMAKASDMVALAADLNEKLSASQAAQAASPLGLQSGGAIESEEAAFVRSSLVQLGLQLPGGAVTQDMASDDRKWHAELARELSSLLQGSASSDSRKAAPQGLMSTRPIVPLDEVWGAWNRARGVALLPPATLLAILPLLPAATNPPLGERKLRSGLRVLHTPDFESSTFAVRVAADLTQDEHGGQTTAEIAHAEGIAVALAREMVEEAELGGHLLREDPATRIEGGGGGMGAAQIGWWPNLLKGYEWDGQE